MSLLVPKQPALKALALSLAFLVPGATPITNPFENSNSAVAVPKGMRAIAELRDFRDVEVRGAGLVLTKDINVHISAVGGGDRVFWRDMFNDDERSQMYAAGWIINADSREVVWEMTMDNTSGRSHRRIFDGSVNLKRGAYEVYYAAHGYFHGSAFSNSSINIDRRKGQRGRWSGSRFFGIFGGDNKDMYDEFMEYAREYGITVSADDADAVSVEQFAVPSENKRVVFAATKLGDEEMIKKGLFLSKDVTLHIYALGEGRKRDETYDHGWIVNSETRKRIWEMGARSIEHAGGASKNIRFSEDVQFPKGTYELYFVTDGSHSNDDWNAKPPYDPFRYGITITVLNDADKNSVRVGDVPGTDKNVIVNLTRVRDDEFVSAGFSLESDMKVRVYSLGERDHDDELADYGWIVDAKTRARVWSMNDRETYHAGGDTKNRLVDEIISLPKGNYTAYYQTDGSHSYSDWNADPPYDEEHWGLTVMGVGEKFDPRSIGSFEEESEESDVLVQLVRVRDGRHMVKDFTLDRSTKVRIYAIGEGVDREMADYGWIEDAKTGDVVWEMTYRKTERAGSAQKNRMVSEVITLEKGEYELHYRSDDSHSYNDWNDDPPEDRTHWGITIYKEN